MAYSLAAVFAMGMNVATHAKPEIKPLGANIAELGSEYYSFKVKEFASNDKQRIYKVWLGIPKANQNIQQKLPAVFMLDGNAVMSHLNDPLLKALTENDSPVLVAIGYKTNLPFESASRSLDYTPADMAAGQPAPDPRSPERMSGGSAEFRKMLLNNIAPWVEQNVKLDANKRAVWGHSYGGLFVLDSLLAGDYFSHYFAASPSLSWADNRMMDKINAVKIKAPTEKHVLLMEGDVSMNDGEKQSSNFDMNGIDKNRKILSNFDEQGIDAKFLIYPNLKHGQVFKASLMDVLLNKLH